jgi:competence CoiA-like predicted nuclease
MDYINFITNEKILSQLKGSKEEDIKKLELQLQYNIPMALREYLEIMGDKTNFYEYVDEHGTQEIFKLRIWMHEWIDKYRSKGISLNEIESILPFFNFQDTFFYIKIEDANNNPAVYAFDINEKPTIRMVSDSFVDFVKNGYNALLKKYNL